MSKNKQATFLTSAADSKGFPEPSLPEIAIVGRSNVGKSSLINALVGMNKLAKTSNTPGRTRLINWFHVLGKPEFFLVDLPGYGYAKVSKQMRRDWQTLIESYLTSRPVLKGVLLLLDARREIHAEDKELLEWFSMHNIETRIVITKTDKFPKNQRKIVGMKLQKSIDYKKKMVLTSAESKEGLEQLWRVIESLLNFSKRS